MFFFLSKALGYLVMPLVLVVGLFLTLAWIKSKRWRKRLFWTAFSLLVFFSNEFIANEVMTWWEIAPTPFSRITKTHDYGIILTGVTNNDSELTDRVFFQHGADRVVHAVDLYKRGLLQKIIVSGGTGRLITASRKEADEIWSALILMGVPADRILIENQSRNTYESAKNVQRLLHDDGQSDLLLITSGFHMRRSLACFKNAGLEVTPFTTDFYTHPRYYTVDVLIIPKVDALVIWHKLFKEWTGFVAYWAAGYV